MARCLEVNTFFSNPRIAAGGPQTDDVLKCHRRKPRRPDYKATFTGEQWGRLLATFATGVCDWTKSGVGQRPSIPWLTFQDAQGRVIPGGKPLGAAPASKPL